MPIICWVASETLNRQCSTSESLSNLEASFGLISRFESIAHRYNYFCVCVLCSNSSIILLFLFFVSFLIITYSVRLSLTLHFVLKGIRRMYSGTVSLEYHAGVSISFCSFVLSFIRPSPWLRRETISLRHDPIEPAGNGSISLCALPSFGACPLS